MKYRDFNLTKFIKSAGCAAKLDPADLNQNVANLIDNDERLLSSTHSNEDASVFSICDFTNEIYNNSILNSSEISQKNSSKNFKSDKNLCNKILNFGEISLVQTLDFITPLVDDPFIYGQIAAANSISDIFAMGAKPINALNIVGFDECNFGGEILSEILAGGKSKIKEAGAVLVGGHTIRSAETFYGLSVTGLVKGRDFWANNTAVAGDVLILTKPIGTGIITTAIKSKMIDFKDFEDAIESMISLNFKACEILRNYEIHACTDVTGFGFLGHLSEMLNKNISFEVSSQNFHYFKSVKKCLEMGLIPGGSYKNLEFVSKLCDKKPPIELCDAQTSGGLLAAVSENEVAKVLNHLQNEGIDAFLVGFAVPKKEFEIYIK